ETWPDDALKCRIEELVRRSHTDDELLQAIRKSREYFRAHFGPEPSASAERDTEFDEFVRAGRERAVAENDRLELAQKRVAEAVNGNVCGKSGTDGKDELENLLYAAQPFAS